LLITYGWSERLQREFEPFAAEGFAPGRIIVQHRGGWRLAMADGEHDAVAAGRLLMDAAAGGLPTVGDWVAVEAAAGASTMRIRHVLPRTTAFIRRAAGTRGEAQAVAANVDVALLVASLNADLNLRRLERYLATAYESGAQPVIVLTKADVAEDPCSLVTAVEAIAFGVPVLMVSAITGEGLPGLRDVLRAQETAVLLGSSGAGKSTLVNALLGEDRMATAAIREDDAHGRHTTTHRELVPLPWGALILDTPGMRELGLLDADAGVSAVFADIEALADGCRFGDCGHDTEPGCAVQAALASGALDPERWRSYGKLQAELAFERRKADPREASEHRRHWVTIHKAARARMKSKYGADDR
jgi:ribosome biogenesis GTPase